MRENQRTKAGFTARVLYGVLALLALGILLLIALIAINRLTSTSLGESSSAEVSPPADFDGIISINPPQEMPDFALRDQYGDAFTLGDLRGRHVLLTFGYTNCPDVCPLTLNEFRRIRQGLGELKEQVAFVFVSVDGKRDTAQVINDYFALRKLEGIIGLTGDEPTVRALGVDYGLSFELVEGKSRSAYLVNHTAGSFLLDPHGRWIMRYQFGAVPSTIVEDLKSLLAA